MHGITGFVRNLSDGSVYLEAEGTIIQMAPFLEWCRRGPDFGYVEDLETTTGDVMNFSEFRIEH
jgi:acylphosphatase